MPYDDIYPFGDNEDEVLSAVEGNVRAILNETTQGFWLTTELDNWAKEAVVDISVKSLCVEDTMDISVTAPNVLYTGTAYEAVIYIHAAWIVVSNTYRSLQKIHPRHMHVQDSERVPAATAGAPYYISLFGQQASDSTVVIFPVPDASYTVTMLYSKVTDDIIELPDQYRPLVVDYVLSRAYQKEKAFHASGASYDRYFTGLALNMRNFFNREVDSMDMLRLPDQTIME